MEPENSNLSVVTVELNDNKEELELPTEVRILINKVKALLDRKSIVTKSISDPKLFLLTLNELDNLIEMDAAKKSIVQQIQYLLINSSRKGPTDTKGKFDGHVLHTVIYGPPGVGKTQLGSILAKIWIGIGLAKPNKASAPSGPDKSSNLERLKDAIYISRILELRSTVSSQQGRLKKAYDLLSKEKEVVTQLRRRIIRLKPPTRHVGLELSLEEREEQHDWEEIIRESRELRTHLDSALKEVMTDPKDSEDPPVTGLIITGDRSPDKEKEKEKENTDDYSNIMTIVGRGDLVGEYQGHSAAKTLALLKANLGKVVFIDEAYSLINGDRDSFGQEALTTLNQFMSEHSHEIVVIFAGYKDLMQKTIFETQPGLRRRCPWVFEIEGYTPKALGNIFRQQIEKRNHKDDRSKGDAVKEVAKETGPSWSLDTEIDTAAFFQQHEKEFPSYGGDTERLAYYSKLTYSSCKFDQVYENLINGLETPLDNIITKEMLIKALSQLKTNDANKTPDDRDTYRSMYI